MGFMGFDGGAGLRPRHPPVPDNVLSFRAQRAESYKIGLQVRKA